MICSQRRKFVITWEDKKKDCFQIKWSAKMLAFWNDNIGISNSLSFVLAIALAIWLMLSLWSYLLVIILQNQMSFFLKSENQILLETNLMPSFYAYLSIFWPFLQEQVFSENDAFFAWTFVKRQPLWQTLLSFFWPVLTLAICLFPVYPHQCKLLILYSCAGVLLLILSVLLCKFLCSFFSGCYLILICIGSFFM